MRPTLFVRILTWLIDRVFGEPDDVDCTRGPGCPDTENPHPYPEEV